MEIVESARALACGLWRPAKGIFSRSSHSTD